MAWLASERICVRHALELLGTKTVGVCGSSHLRRRILCSSGFSDPGSSTRSAIGLPKTSRFAENRDRDGYHLRRNGLASSWTRYDHDEQSRMDAASETVGPSRNSL